MRIHRIVSGRCVLSFLVGGLFAAHEAAAQSTTVSGFAAGVRDIVNLDFAATPIGEVPKGLRLLQGNLDVVDKDGMHMLRASSPSEFVIQLPEVLPKDFTVEFELIPKACCNPEDLMLEGVLSGSRSSVSAQLTWHPAHLMVVGGNSDMFQMDMPAAIAAVVPSALTKIAVSFEDETVKMYTNGRRLFTLNERKFVRGRVMRIFLGGQDDDKYAVYLARLRIADLAPVIVAQNAPQAGPRSVSPMPTSQPNAVTPPPAASASAVPAGFNITVAPGSGGPVVSWPPLSGASGYTVSRHKIDDVGCCNSSSGRGWLMALSWQDTPLPVSGRYVYLVLANTPAGQLRGQASFDYVQPVPTVTPPIGASLGSVPSGFTVSVTMGATGPLVSWTPLPNASQYAVERYKIDDLACCGSTSGRTPATSPWQDAPLPMSGTYTYRVTANTPAGQVYGETLLGFRLPGGSAPSQPAPVNAVLVSPTTTGTVTPMTAPTTAVLVAPTTTGTITPMPASTAPTITSPTATSPTSGSGTLNPNQTAVLSSQPSGGGAPAQIWFGLESPVSVRVFWDWPTTASQYIDIGYSVRRAIAGTTNWTQLTPVPLKQTFVLDDVVPDPRQTYTYVVTATHLDGTSGSTSANFTPPAPKDPTDFAGQVVAPGEVLLTWSRVGTASQFLLTGPGMGNGLLTDGQPTTGGAHKHTYTVKGLPPGTHTWHLATSYQPGGVLTAPSSWPVASATIGVTTGKYMITVESVRSNNDAVDDITNLDGIGNEILVLAEIDLRDKSGQVVQSLSKSSTIFGDVGALSLAGTTRVQAGSVKPNGGIGPGDVISPIWEQPNAPQPGTGYTPLVLWQGQLTDGAEIVTIVPSIWEWDDGTVLASLSKWRDYVKRNAVALDLSQRTTSGDISNVMLPEPSHIPSISYGAMGTFIFEARDRPIGVARDWPVTFYPDDGFSLFYPIAIRITQSVAEATIAGAYGSPGIIPIRFVDHQIGSKSTAIRPEFGFGDFTLNLRIDRIP